MVKKKLIGAAGRFGSRYGQRVRRKIADIESKQRKKQTCPFCGKTVKRVSKGIWQCKKCKKRFAGHSYYLEKGLMVVKKSQILEHKKEAQDIKEAAKKDKKEKVKKKSDPKTTKKPTTKKTTAKKPTTKTVKSKKQKN